MTTSYFDVWKKRMNNNGDLVQSRLNSSKNIINDNFKDDPSYRLGKLKKRENLNDEIDLDTRLVNNDDNPLEKRIYLRPDTIIETGDYITYLDSNITYLVLSVETNLVSPKANSKECNHLLKWMYKGKLYQSPSIVINATKYTTGIDASNLIVEVDARYSIDIPRNEETKTIQLGSRFIINNLAWEVTQIDYTTSQGILKLTLGKSSKTSEYDNLELEIADYYLHDYVIKLNSTSETLQESGTYQITANVTDKGISISNPSVIYESSDETIAKVDDNGLVTGMSTGNCTINCNIGEISTSLTLTVVTKTSTPLTSYTCDWSTSKTSIGCLLKTYMSSTAICKKTTDGIEDSSLIVNYSLDSVGSTLLSNGSITITRKTNTSFLVKNVSVNTNNSFVIQFINSSDGTIINSSTVQLSGM